MCVLLIHSKIGVPRERWLFWNRSRGSNRRAFPPINFLSKSGWNRWGRRPASDLNCSRAEVIDVDYSEDIPYSQQYLVATSTKLRTYWCPPKAKQSPKTMSIWTLSRYWRHFLMVLPLGLLAMVAKEPIVDRRRPDFIRLALVATVRCFWLRNCLQPKMLWRFRDLNCVRLFHGAGVDDRLIGGRLVASMWTRLRVRMEISYTEFFCRVALVGSVGGTLAKSWGRQSMSI